MIGQAVESGRFSRKTGSFWVQRVVLVAKADIFPTVFATTNRICTRKVTSRGVCGAGRSDVATCSAQRRPCCHPLCSPAAGAATRRAQRRPCCHPPCSPPAGAATRRAHRPPVRLPAVLTARRCGYPPCSPPAGAATRRAQRRPFCHPAMRSSCGHPPLRGAGRGGYPSCAAPGLRGPGMRGARNP